MGKVDATVRRDTANASLLAFLENEPLTDIFFRSQQRHGLQTVGFKAAHIIIVLLLLMMMMILREVADKGSQKSLGGGRIGVFPQRSWLKGVLLLHHHHGRHHGGVTGDSVVVGIGKKVGREDRQVVIAAVLLLLLLTGWHAHAAHHGWWHGGQGNLCVQLGHGRQDGSAGDDARETSSLIGASFMAILVAVMAVVARRIRRDTARILVDSPGTDGSSSILDVFVTAGRGTTDFLALLLLHGLAGAVLGVQGIAKVLRRGCSDSVFFDQGPTLVATTRLGRGNLADKVARLADALDQKRNDFGLGGLVFGIGVGVHNFADQLAVSEVARVLGVLLASANNHVLPSRRKVFREKGDHSMGAAGLEGHLEEGTG